MAVRRQHEKRPARASRLLMALLRRACGWLASRLARLRRDWADWREEVAVPAPLRVELLEPRLLMSADWLPGLRSMASHASADPAGVAQAEHRRVDAPHGAMARVASAASPTGVTVSAEVSGPGIATVTEQGGRYSLALNGTTALTQVRLVVAGADGPVNLAGIQADAALGILDIRAATLTGNAIFSDGVGRLLANDIHDSLITVGGTNPFKLVARSLADTVLRADGASVSIEAQQWTASTPDGSALEVAALKSLAVAGNFAANLTVTGTTPAAYALETTLVGGEVSGRWSVAGRANTVQVGSSAAAWRASFGGSLALFATQRDAGGLLAASSLQLLQIGGSMRGMTVLAGANLGSDAQLGGTGSGADSFRPGVLARVRITGDMVDSRIVSSVDPRDGMFFNGDDVALGGTPQRIQEFAVGGQLRGATHIVAPGWPATVRIGGAAVASAGVPNFRVTPPALPQLNIAVALQNDTGASATDRITRDPAVVATIGEPARLAALSALLDPANDGRSATDILGRVQPDGRVTLDAALLDNLARQGQLTSGTHLLRLTGTDTLGRRVQTELSFTLLDAAPAVSVALQSDSGTSASDRITQDCGVNGAVGQGSLAAGTRLLASLDGSATPVYADISSALQPDGHFSLSAAEMNRLAGRNLTDGTVTLKLRVIDVAGNSRDLSFSYILDAAATGLSAALRADTGTRRDDGLTRDLTIDGRVGRLNDAVSLQASLDGRSAVKLIGGVQADGRFTLSRETLNELAAGALRQGAHTLGLETLDAAGNRSRVELAFHLDDIAPDATAAFAIGVVDRVDGDPSRTDAARVTLTGSGEPGSVVELARQGVSTIVAADGRFSLARVSLDVGDNPLQLSFADAAGNKRTVSHTLSRAVAPAHDPVLDWVYVSLATVQRDATDPPLAARALAIESIAVHDALAAIQGTPAYLVAAPAEPASSADAASAAAAHRVLSVIYPAQRALLDAALASSLAAMPDGTAKTAGVALGRRMADQVIAIRVNDGSLRLRDFQGSDLPGQWRATAPLYLTADQTDWGLVDPFALTAGDQFRAPPPPALDSAEYARQLDEVRLLGAANSALRTADQTQQALFWADGAGSTTPPGHWNQIAAQVAQSKGLGSAASARLFAQLNVAMADAAIAAWDTKFAYNSWRPLDGIHDADLDGNAATALDVAWRPLLITPPHPDYVSGHSTFSAAAAAVLGDTFGDATAFSTTSATLPGVARSFSSFSQAAVEAGDSRIFGGIHTRAANEAGKDIGRKVGAAVLARFNQVQDQTAPKVVLEATPAATRSNVQIHGQVLDNLSGVSAAEVRLDNGVWQALPLNAQGHFNLTTAFALDGSQDGRHSVEVRVRDTAGNLSAVSRREMLLDTRAPVVSLQGLTDSSTLADDARLSGQIESASAIVSLSVSLNGGAARPVNFDPATGRFDQALELRDLSVGPVALTLLATDAAGNVGTGTRQLVLAALPRFGVTQVTPTQGSIDNALTYRPQVFFSRAVNPATLNADSFYATGPDGQRLETTLVPAQDGGFVWMFFKQPLPGSARITLHLNGDAIRAQAGGAALDADGDRIAGGQRTWSFTTVSTAAVAGTRLVGKLVDPGPDLLPMTFDDIRRGPDGVIHTPDDVFLRPIAGAIVSVIGRPDLVAITDAIGNFAFDNLPAGDLKVRVDGRTATNAPEGTFFPEMVMDVQLLPGKTNTLMGTMGSPESRHENLDRVEVYLPRVRSASLQPVSDSQPTTITTLPEAAPNLTDEQRARLSITTAPGSAVGPDGQVLSNVQIGINVVPFELIKDMLPPGLAQNGLFITIQSPGVETFTAPLAISMPNTSGAAPGAKLSVLSFDHTTGLITQTGTATVSADGLSVTSDPGSGILAPGWHGFGGGGPLNVDRPESRTGTPSAYIAGMDRDQLFFAADEGYSVLVKNVTPPSDAQSPSLLVKYSVTSWGSYNPVSFVNPTDKRGYTGNGHEEDASYDESGSFVLRPGENETVELTFRSPEKIVNRLTLFGAQLRVQTFAMDSNGNAMGSPVHEKAINLFHLLGQIDSEPGDGIFTLPAFKSVPGDETDITVYSYLPPSVTLPEFRFTRVTEQGSTVETDELYFDLEILDKLSLKPANTGSDGATHSGLTPTYKIELRSHKDDLAFGSFSVNAFGVRPTQIVADFPEFIQVFEQKLLSGEQSGLWDEFKIFLDENPDYAELELATQVGYFAYKLFDLFMKEMEATFSDVGITLTEQVEGIDPNADIIRLRFDTNRRGTPSFNKEIFEAHLGEGGSLANEDAVLRGLTNNYTPGALRPLDVLGVDAWKALRYADSIEPARTLQMIDYARFLAAEFGAEIGVLRGLQYRTQRDGFGARIASTAMMAELRYDPFERVYLSDAEREVLGFRVNPAATSATAAVEYYEAWRSDTPNSLRPTFQVNNLDQASEFGVNGELEIFTFEVTNTSIDEASTQDLWVHLELEGNQGEREFIEALPAAVWLSPGETREFTIRALDNKAIADAVTLYGAKLRVSITGSGSQYNDVFYEKSVDIYHLVSGVNIQADTADGVIQLPLTGTGVDSPGTRVKFIHAMDEAMIPQYAFKRQGNAGLEPSDELSFPELGELYFKPEQQRAYSGMQRYQVLEILDRYTRAPIGSAYVTAYEVRPTLVSIDEREFSAAFEEFMDDPAEITGSLANAMQRFLALPENSDIPDDPVSQLQAFKAALYAAYLSSLTEVFAGLPEFEVRTTSGYPYSPTSDRLRLGFNGEEPTPGLEGFDYETFASSRGLPGLARDYEALGRGFTHGYDRAAYPDDELLALSFMDMILDAELAAGAGLRPTLAGYAHVLAQVSAQQILLARGVPPVLSPDTMTGVSGPLSTAQPVLSEMERLITQARNGTLTDPAQRTAVVNHFVAVLPSSMSDQDKPHRLAPSSASRQAAAAVEDRHALGILQVASAPLTRSNETPTPVAAVDLGTTVADGTGGASAGRSIYLGNSGTGDLTIRSVRFIGAANGFTATFAPGAATTLAAPRHDGGTSTFDNLAVHLGFDPSVAGSATAVIEVVADTGQGSVVRRITLRADSRPGAGMLEVDKEGANLGGHAMGAPAVVTRSAITLHNPGASPLTITELSIADLGAGFSLVGLPNGGVSAAHPLVLAAGQTRTLDVAFAASKLGLQRALLTIRSSDPAQPVQTVMLAGTGTVATGIDASAQYGRDHVGVKQDGRAIGSFLSDNAGGWGSVVAPYASRVDATVFDPVSGLVAHANDPDGRAPEDRLRLTPFAASIAPDTDGDGLSDDIEFAIGTNSLRRDSDGNGVDDFDQFQQRNQRRTDISASPGETISVQVPFDAATAQATFSVVDDNGARSTLDVFASGVDAATGTVRFVVPDNAQTGEMVVFGLTGGTRSELPFMLQILPKLTGIEVVGVNPDGRSALVVLTGLGLVDDATQYHFGSATVIDSTPSTTPVEGPVLRGNRVTMIVPLTDGSFGAIRATTAAGTSATLNVELAGLTAAALVGTPADTGAASANAGQAVTVNGSGLTLQSGLLLRWLDGAGDTRYTLLRPASVTAAGTQAVIVIPPYANGAFGLRMLGTTNQPLLQIVPTLALLTDSDSTLTLQGSGFVEGAARYAVSGSVVDDTSMTTSADVQANGAGIQNAQARLDAAALARRGFGQASVQTAGGTSNSVSLNTLRPATDNGPVGALRDLAIDAASGQFWVADAANAGRLLRIDTRDGRVLQSLTLPAGVGSPSDNVSLQVLQQAISLATTNVPAGSLLVFNGGSTPDLVVALNATTGAVIASLSLANYNLTAAVFDPTTGQLWVADARGGAQRLVRLDPNTGAELGAIPLPISLSSQAALAIHPVTGHLWVGSNTMGAQVLELARDGSIRRRLDLGTQGLTGVVTGLAFSSDGVLHAASTGGVVLRARLDLDSAVVRPTLSAVVASAAQGVAGQAHVAASNAGQVIELLGTHFDASTRVVFEQRDSIGRISQVAVKPLVVSADGTRLQVRVSDLATTGMVRVVNSGTGNVAGLGVADSRYRQVTVSFVATQSTTVLRFADGGLDPVSQQSWGLDNVRVRQGSMTVFEDDFEGAGKNAWSDRSVDTTALGTLGRFSGRFNGLGGQSLTLHDLQPGQTYTLSFDLLVLDLWSSPDAVIRITADDRPIWRESFVNAINMGADTVPVQSHGQSEGARLQIVPTLTGFSLGQASSGAPAYTISGTGFVASASVFTLGGQLLATPNVGLTEGSLPTDGPLRVTTEGGHAELTRVSVDTKPLPGRISSFSALAATGTAAIPGQASANSGQVLTFDAVGNLGNAWVQFTATDSQGQLSTVTARAARDPQTGRFTVTVPAAASTGVIRVLGTEFSAQLQIVPTLRASSGRVVPGQVILIEGTGLAQAGSTVMIDGRPATVTEVRRVNLGSNQERELVGVLVPIGAQAGELSVSTPGGSAVLRSSQALPMADATHLSEIVAVAEQGTAHAIETASANVGQTIRLLGIALRADDRVVFTCIGADGNLYEQTVSPTVVDLAAGRVSVVVPEQATTGRVRLERDGVGLMLQIVPKVSGLAAGTTSGEILILGSGFSEGALRVAVGAQEIMDNGINAGLDVRNRRVTGGPSSNSAIAVPLGNGLPSGAIVVHTDGGSSAPLARSVTGVFGTAPSGTPVDPAAASAAPGQTVTVTGSGLDFNTWAVFQVIDADGVRREQVVRANGFDPSGTSAAFIVPEGAVSGLVRVLGDASGRSIQLQIVPQVVSARVVAIWPDGKSAVVVVEGLGFVEGGDSEYWVGGQRVFDAGNRLGADVSVRDTPNGGIANGQVTLTVPVQGGVVGDITVRTAGGTSITVTPTPVG